MNSSENGPLSDLVDRFEQGLLPGLPHLDHVRLAWAYLERHDAADALASLVAGLSRFAATKGHPDKFHYTMTRAWLDLVIAARQIHPDIGTPEDLLRACPLLADSRALGHFYSDAAIHTPAARTTWVGPDLRPLDPTL